jgi:adenylyl- and sulfurtransferase ThiI
VEIAILGSFLNGFVDLLIMLPDTILLRYGEIFLKGKNRNYFEKKLVENIKKIAAVKKIKKLRSRFVVDFFKSHSNLRKVFGLTSYSPSFRVEKDIMAIKKKALEMLDEKGGSFKVNSKRSDKTFLVKSPDLNVLVGEHVESNSELKFSFSNPDNILKIEINQEGAYLFFETIECFGGLPTGVEGKVDVLIENEASLLAGLMFMKRGCNIFPVSFYKKEISLLQKFSPIKLELKIIKDLSELRGEVLVVGDNFDNLKEHEVELMVMKPLIAFNEEKIGKELEKFKA